MMNKKIILAASAASILFGASAASAATQSATATADILEQVNITKTDDLAFGTIVVGTTGDTVSISNDGADTVACGALTCTGTATAAEFEVTGTEGQALAFTIPATVSLVSGSNSMTVTLAPSMADGDAIGTGGSSTLYVGGDLAVAGSQASGAYSGNFDVTVDYQ